MMILSVLVGLLLLAGSVGGEMSTQHHPGGPRTHPGPRWLDGAHTAGELGNPSQKFVGWIGPYHPSSGTTWAAPGVKNGTSVWEAFEFGTVCMENAVSDGGYALEKDIELHCDTWDVNSVYGMLLPPQRRRGLEQPERHTPLLATQSSWADPRRSAVEQAGSAVPSNRGRSDR